MKMGRGKEVLLWFAVVAFTAVFVHATEDDEAQSQMLVCEEGFTRCNDNSRCYSSDMRCDAFSDCADGSDEDGCGPVTCQSHEFQCVSGECIPANYRCDESPDCGDESDEDKCHEAVVCDSSSEFLCEADNKCINDILKCDGVAHCADGSDEHNCTNTREEHVAVVTSGGQSPCDENQFQCSTDSSQCISNDLMCNGESDCENGADEGDELCDKQNQSAAEVHTCEQGGEWCAQLCHDDAEGGGYKCACHEGYLLADDKHTCTASSGTEWLWVTDGSSLNKYELATNRDAAIDFGRHIDALDYDFVENKTFWACSHNHTINRMNVDGSDSEIILTDIARPLTLSYDWVHDNIYWTDSNRIEVVTASRKLRHDLFSELVVHHVRTLAVDPRTHQRFLYWGQAGGTPGIHRAGLDGSGHQRIVTSDIQHPTAMTMDFASGHGKLLWLDSGRHSIMSLDLSTLEPKLMYEIAENNQHLTGLAVSTEFLFWAEKDSGTVYSIQKAAIRYGETEEPEIQLESVTLPKNVLVHHHLKQPAGHNACGSNNGGCSHICLPSPTGSASTHKCVCPDVGVSTVYTISTDGRTCTGRADAVQSNDNDDDRALVGSTLVDANTRTSTVNSNAATNAGDHHRAIKPGGQSSVASSGSADGGATRSAAGSSVNVGKKHNDVGVAGSSTAGGQGQIAAVWTLIISAVGALLLSFSRHGANRI